MRIFFSHSSRDKPLLREIKHFLPGHVNVWIDELEIPVGAPLSTTIKTAIKRANDLVVCFLGPEAVKSPWVKRELRWASERERHLRRNFIIPVVLDNKSWLELPKSFQDRKYLLCTNFTLSGVKQFAGQLYEELFFYFLTCAQGSSHNADYERKTEAHQIAIHIADDQVAASGQAKLTKPRLRKILSCLDPQSRVFLLLIYELVEGKYSGPEYSSVMERADFLNVELEVPGSGTWSHVFDRSENSVISRTLRYDYGLGDKKYMVRTVFLNGIKSFGSDEKRKVFHGIKILNIGTER